MEDKIKKIMSIVFDVPLNLVTDNSTQDEFPNWDSLRHIEMIVMIEKEFDITIPDEETPNMIHFKLIKSIINNKMSKKK